MASVFPTVRAAAVAALKPSVSLITVGKLRDLLLRIVKF
jgi:hypothetical protein